MLFKQNALRIHILEIFKYHRLCLNILFLNKILDLKNLFI